MSEPLTAEEGANRIKDRRGPRKRPGESEPPYVCESCGESEFQVYRTYELQRGVCETLECSCREFDTAATNEYIEAQTITVPGRLMEDHQVDWSEGEIDSFVEDENRQELESSVECERCLEAAEVAEDWQIEADDWEVVDESEHWEVRCSACDHEIEFGWSHPTRGGRIWPCESSDFNPRKCFPEPRFLENWRRRGWLRLLK